MILKVQIWGIELGIYQIKVKVKWRDEVPKKKLMPFCKKYTWGKPHQNAEGWIKHHYWISDDRGKPMWKSLSYCCISWTELIFNLFACTTKRNLQQTKWSEDLTGYNITQCKKPVTYTTVRKRSSLLLPRPLGKAHSHQVYSLLGTSICLERGPPWHWLLLPVTHQGFFPLWQNFFFNLEA